VIAKTRTPGAAAKETAAAPGNGAGEAAMDRIDNVLEIKGLVKDFSSVRAVNDVSFDIRRNTVHCLVGENGAGKSTLIKILTGAL